MNAALLLWETEEKYENKNEQFKQAMVQAFPQLYEDIYDLNKSEDSLENFDQVVPSTEQEYESIVDFLEGLHSMSSEELVE
jgi:hypothetical protein